MDEVTTKFVGEYYCEHEWAGLQVTGLIPTQFVCGHVHILGPSRILDHGGHPAIFRRYLVCIEGVEFGSALHRAVEALLAGEVLQTIDWLRDNYPEETAALTAYLEERLVA